MDFAKWKRRRSHGFWFFVLYWGVIVYGAVAFCVQLLLDILLGRDLTVLTLAESLSDRAVAAGAIGFGCAVGGWLAHERDYRKHLREKPETNT